MVKVAALQFASTTDLDENLTTCLRLIDSAARQGVQLMVLPEFSNHLSWYEDAEQAWRVALDIDGEFLSHIAGRARHHGSFIVINVSLRNAGGGITVSSVCFSPRGELCGRADKQTLMGHENLWFERAQRRGDLVDAPFGRFAMFPCRDGVTCETPRGLALRGAQLFCDSLNSFALDEASLHVPARAPENKVFLVAANKVGPLIPRQLLQAVSEETHIPLRFLHGAGESQVVDPLGRVLARGPAEGEAVVSADIELSLANDKRRPDGTDLFAARRPALYRAIARQPTSHSPAPAAEQLAVACLATQGQGRAALEELPALIDALPQDTALAVLPELFCHEPGDAPDLRLSAEALRVMQHALARRPQLSLCASLYRPLHGGVCVSAVLVGSQGMLAEQPRLHHCAAQPDLVVGDTLRLVDMPWGRLAILSGHDALFPELVKVAAIDGAQVLALPSRFSETWEEAYGLRSRAAENRLCVVASSMPLHGRAGLILDLERDFTLMTEWRERSFDGFINAPLVTEQIPGQGVTTGRLHPRAADNKLMSQDTDLLLDRPWRLSADLLEPQE